MSRGTGGGLPEHLVQAGLLDEKSLAEAVKGAREAHQNLVTYLVGRNLVDSRELATAAAALFGTPVMDLDALVVDLDVVRLVPEKVLAQSRTLPLARRGRRLFVAISDPTNLHGLDEIRFSTAMQVEPIVVEDDKLQRALARVLEQFDTSMRSLGEGDLDLEKLGKRW
jgi:type IV pilus assembly protein PilB